MVEKQLQIIFQIDLVSNLSALPLLRAKSEGEMSMGMPEGAGSAKEKLDERYSKAHRIILLGGRYLRNVIKGKLGERVCEESLLSWCHHFCDCCEYTFPDGFWRRGEV